ncbi:hypothetical protein, partial [Luteitalea sp.]|uniref:hypothetical protein n=1 Tax=Luteitalea sp. TaxID=2004800 RepID=UPI0025C3F4D5
ADAQSPPQVDGADSGRPMRTLFGGATDEIPTNQGLNLSAALFGGYDDDIFARGQNPGLGRPRVSGEFIGGQAGLRYFKRVATATVQATGATSARYVTDSQELVPTFHAGTIAVAKEFGPRTSLQVQQLVLYRPFFSAAPFPGQSGTGATFAGAEAGVGGDVGAGIGAGLDDTTISSERTALQYATSAIFTRRLSARSRFEFFGMYGQSNFGQSAQTTNVDNTRAQLGGRYVYDLTSFLAARLGYGARRYGATGGQGGLNHDIDIGLVLNRPFQFRQGRTEFSAITGTTLLVRDRVAIGQAGGDRTLFRVIGTGRVRHTFRGDWVADAAYTRSVGFLDGFLDPFQGDMVTTSLSGLLTRALEFQAQAGYMSGAIGMQDRNFDTALAGARLRLGLTQKLALFAQYFYFQYAYDDDVAAQLLVAPELERQGFRAGLTVWLPVLR